MDLTKTIELKAENLGFKLFGVTSPASPKNYPIFEKWLMRKYFGDMKYLDSLSLREKRQNPIQLFPECKSVIIVGLPYNSGKTFSSQPWKIASFALHADYHPVIQNKLTSLLDFIIKITNGRTMGKIFCDSSPILEKELAERAGLGKIGRNSLLISPKYGSFFNLGELFLNIEIPITQPRGDDPCKGCYRCLKACPTQCILDDRTLIATQCISYLTIEHKGIIPAGLRTRIDSWIYGCDICQSVCPWNRETIQQTISLTKPNDISNKNHSATLLEELFEVDRVPIFSKARVKQKVLRNIAICLGNSHEINEISALKELFFNENLEIRVAAAWAIGQITHPESKQFLKQQLKIEKQEQVRNEILNNLER